MTSTQNISAFELADPSLKQILKASARTASRNLAAPMEKAAIYSRYSTDRQSELSVERQREICEEHAARFGLTVAAVFSDRAKSGTTFVGRMAFEAMLQAAQRHEFGTLIVENVDRLARDLSDLSGVFKMLTQLGIEMHQPGRGRLGLPDIAFHGFMGEEGRRLFLDRTRRGRLKKARLGKSSSPVSYGYARVLGQPGERVIVPEQSEVVKDIYRLRLERLTTRQISLAMNARGNTGKTWTTSTIRNVLANPLYAGVYVYNRNFWEKDPLTGLSNLRSRDPSEWIVVPVEHLRIVERSVWDAVQAMQRTNAQPVCEAQAPVRKYLLSGKVKCSVCGGRMSASGVHQKRSFSCGSKKAGGTCKAPLTLKIEDLERFVIGLVAEKILEPAGLEAYVEAYNEARTRSSQNHEALRAKLRREANDLYEELKATLLPAITEGLTPPDLVMIREELSRKRAEKERELALVPLNPAPVGIDRRCLTMLREAVEGLAARVPFRPENEADYRLAAAFGELIDHIVVRRLAYGKYEATVHLTVMPLIEGGSASLDESSGLFSVRAPYSLEKVFNRVYPWESHQTSHLAAERFILADFEWDAIKHLLPDGLVLQYGGRGPWNYRSLVQAHLFILMTGTPFRRLPERFGSWQPTYLAISKLVNLGVWRELVTILSNIDPDRFQPGYAEVVWNKVIKPSADAVRLVSERRAAEAAIQDCPGA